MRHFKDRKDIRAGLKDARRAARLAQRRYLDALIQGTDPAEAGRLYQELHRAEQSVRAIERRR